MGMIRFIDRKRQITEMVAMVTKTLKKMEVVLGFVQIPAESRAQLVGNKAVPFDTKLNDAPARIDKYGRLWSAYLKNRYPVGTEVTISKNDSDFQITSNGQEQQCVASEVTDSQETASLITSLADRNDIWCKVLEGDCIRYLSDGSIGEVSLTFFDPPYRQGKDYRFFDDKQPDREYWGWTKEILGKVYEATADGGAVYFMQREKNTEQVLRVLRKTGWKFQNLIVWKKKTSAVPCSSRFSKQYQIIAFATKGDEPRVFNKLRIDYPLSPGYKYPRKDGIYVTDVWDDIRELTAGYFAGDEAIRDSKGNRVHIQQSPVALLLRIILASSLPGDIVLDPLAGSGTTLVVAKQIRRNSVGIEIDPEYVRTIKSRLGSLRSSDDISSYYSYYRFTPNLEKIWKLHETTGQKKLL
jgi:DNA modification methylase